MKFQEIRECKEQFPMLILEKGLTMQFNNKEWSAVFRIKKVFDLKDVIKFCDYCEKHDLIMFFGRSGIHIQ